jgi:hypothetical protein
VDEKRHKRGQKFIAVFGVIWAEQKAAIFPILVAAAAAAAFAMRWRKKVALVL